MNVRPLNDLQKFGLNQRTRKLSSHSAAYGIGNITGRSQNIHNGYAMNVPSKKVVTHLPPLSLPLKTRKTVVYSPKKSKYHKTKVTTLPNGLRVVSESRIGCFCTIGVLIESGSRYESDFPYGISHFLEKLAFNSTDYYCCSKIIHQELLRKGGICDCHRSREVSMYGVSVKNCCVDFAIRLMAETIFRPRFKKKEIEKARKTIQLELIRSKSNKHQYSILKDMIHATAFHNNTLGLPQMCPIENLVIINRNVLFKYMKLFHTIDRMTIAGVGVNHYELVTNAKKYFMDYTKGNNNNNNNKNDNLYTTKLIKRRAMYTGGMLKEVCKIPVYANTGQPQLAFIGLALKGVSHRDDPDYAAMCLLEIIMGGGSMFSPGGPGKGIFSRLCTNVLNINYWLFSAIAVNYSYSDAGLFCIYASAPTRYCYEMIEVIIRAMANTASEPTNDELCRAKMQMQSSLLMNLESRPLTFEHIGKQVLHTTSHRNSPKYFINDIERVSTKDIKRVAERMLRSNPTFVVRGNISDIPLLNDIKDKLRNAVKRRRKFVYQ